MASTSSMVLQENIIVDSTINMYQNTSESIVPQISGQSKAKQLSKLYGFPNLPETVDKREGDVENLRKLMIDNNKVVITGMAGLGKTTLANLCARKWVEDGTYQHAIFVNMETEESASAVYKRLAEIVLDTKNYSENIVIEIHQHLNKDKTLLVFDNIDENCVFHKYNPSKELTNIDILGTSQFTELKRSFHPYPLQVLSEGASVQLILDIFSSAEIEVPATVAPMITDLVVKLDYHPLALQHAAALVIDMCTYDDMSLEQSLNKYKEDFDIKLKEEFPADHPSKYRKSVFVAISLNVKKATIGKEHVKSLLHCMTYLDPSEIYIKIFYKAFSTNDIQESLKLLKRYSLIFVDSGVIISMHRLIPIVCHSVLTADDKIKYLNKLLNVFFYNTDVDLFSMLSSFGRACSFFIHHHMNFDINISELAAYYKAAFHNNDQIKERLTARLQMINCVISDAEGWSAEQCCVFAGHQTFYEYFSGIGLGYRYINNQVGFVQVISDSSLDLFYILQTEKFKFYDHNKEVLNKPVFKNLAILSICAAFGIDDDDFKKLIDMGCDVNITDNNGMTPILWAAKHMSYNHMFILLDRGATCDVIYKEVLTAAAAGDGESVLKLLRESEVSYAKSKYGKMLLWWAADKGHHDIIRQLIQRGTDTSGADARGNTLLHMVARTGYDEIVSQIIRAAGDINIANSHGDTALIHAAQCGHDKIVSELIEAEAEVNIANSNGYTALIWAAAKGHDKTKAHFIGKHPVNNFIKYGHTALKCSANNGHDKIVSELIAAEADLNIVKRNGDTALIVAARNGHDEIVSALIGAGANVNRAGSWGHTALINSIEYRHDKIASKLIGAGADLNMTTSHGDTALIWAAITGNYEIICKLISTKADLNIANSNGDTALIHAVDEGHVTITTQLAQAGANVNVTNNKGDTALSVAARSGYHEVVTELINLGAHVDTANKHGSTPLLLAAEHKNRAISMYLIKKGASVNAVDGDGNTPLLFSTKHGDYELAVELINRGAQTEPPANNTGETPLSWAQRNKDDRMEHIILNKRRRSKRRRN